MKKQINKRYKLLPLYIALLICIMNVCDVLIFKVFNIYGLKIVGSGFVFSFAFLIMNIITECYGFRETEKAMIYILLAQVLFITVLSIAIRIPSPKFVNTSELYYTLFKNLWLVIISGTASAAASFYFNSVVISKLKILLSGKLIIVRFIFSNMLSQALLVVISYFIPYYSILSFEKIALLCFHTWLFKMAATVIIVNISPFFIKLTIKIEHADIYDYNVSYNPIKIFDESNTGENRYGRQIN